MSIPRSLFTAVVVALLLACLSCSTLPRSRRAEAGRSGLEGPPVPGLECRDASGLRFYFTGDTFLERAEELIRDARDYILINVFVIVDDVMGKHVIDLLRERMEDGVRVYVMADSCSGWVSGFVEGRTAVPYLVQQGIPVAEFNPIRANRFARLPGFLYRDHQKCWIVDGETIALGGQNIWSPSLDPPEESGTTDSMVEFRSATAARQLVAGFVEAWNAYSMDKLRVGEFAVPPPAPGAGSGERLWLVQQHRFGEPVMGAMFSRLLDLAEREVWLIQGYTMPDHSVLRKIRELTGRGVGVNILFSSAYHEMDKFYYATGYRMLDLIEAGAVVWEYGHPKSHLHYKGVIVDERWFGIGSANFNYRSCHLAQEINIVFEGREPGAPMLENLEALRQMSSRVTKQEASGRRGVRFFLYFLLLIYGG
ncbi:MAG: phosphatidylserine/phosphatidylglycerophosphate/cardiolipin synthase family protein [Spirochaetales bacterium]|nr:phosphatidylserine/phosphatidylglycerophosphate/cardiolipin synthase family protein [Spirochaetales bacterium]